MRFTFGCLLVVATPLIVPFAALAAADSPATKPGEALLTDLYGDPLPAGAIARLGSIRFLHDGINGLTILPGDKELLGACRHGVCIWDAGSGRPIKHFGQLNGVTCAAVSPDRSAIVVGEDGGKLFVFDVATGRERLQVVGTKEGRPISVAWSADGRWFAAGFYKVAYVWDATTGKLAHRLEGDDYIQAVAVNPNGKSLVAGDRQRVQIWDLASGKPVATCEGGLDTGSRSLTYTLDGSTLVGPCNEPIDNKGSSRSSLRQWDAVTGKKIRDVAGGSFNCAAISPDGKTLAASEGSHIRLWDLATGKELRKWIAHVYHAGTVVFNRDGTRLASTGMDRRIRLWDIATGKELKPNAGHSGPVNALACAPHGRVVASGGPDSTMRCWDVVTGRELSHCDQLGPRMLGFFWGVIDLAYAPDGKTLVSAERHTAKTTFRCWEAGSLKPLSQYDGDHISAIGCGLDNETLLTATWEGNIAVRELTRGKLLSRIGKHVTHLHSLSQSPDGRTVAWVGEYGGFGLLDLKTGKDVFRNTKDVSSAVRVAFAPDGGVLATGGNGGNPVRLWEAATGKRVAEWKDMRSSEVAFSPDGRLLAAATGPFIGLWDVAARAEVLRWTCDHGRAIRLVFALNGQVLVSAHDDGTLLVWDVTGQLKAGKLPRRALNDVELAAHWKAIKSADAAAAHRAIWALAAAAPQSLALAEKCVRPVPAAVDIARLIADLDSEAFEVRNKATQALTELGTGAESALRRALQGNPSLELRRRAMKLLETLDEPAVHARRLQESRTIAVLEYAGDREARQILERLASGAREAGLTLQARAAIDRLARQIQ
jgi:WD40 repeat protein